MLNVFLKNPSDIHYSIKKYGNVDYIKRRYKSEINRVVKYYREREAVVNNNHFLTKLIKAIISNIDINIDQLDYLLHIRSSAIYICKQFGITSNLDFGKLHKSIFYGKNSYELFLYIENDIDYLDLVNYPYSYSAVKLVYNEDSDLDFYIPYGNKDFDIPSLSVYEIDAIGLCMQYRYWAKERLNINMAIDVNSFIRMVVLPNMLPNMFDFSIINRFFNISNNIPNKPVINRHPFHIISLATPLDKLLTDIYFDLHNQSINVEQFLQSIPCIYHKDALEILHLRTSYFNAQSSWVIFLSRIFIIRDIINVLDHRGIQQNLHYTNQLPILFKSLENRSTRLDLYNIPGLELDLKETIEEIKEKIGRR